MIILFGSTGYIGSEFKRQLEQKQIEFKCWNDTANTTFYDLEKFAWRSIQVGQLIFS